MWGVEVKVDPLLLPVHFEESTQPTSIRAKKFVIFVPFFKVEVGFFKLISC